jgi:pimeloyl-ACP methyl ester carboxylesterase
MLETIPTRDNKHIHVRKIGYGKPVVLLHGFGMESRHWIPFILPLINKYQFFLPDLRGFGFSANTQINNSCIFTNFYEDFEDILNYYQLDQVALGGISMGAYVSLFYLSQIKTDRVNKLLCIDQSPSFKHTEKYKYGLGLDDHERWMSDFQNVLTLLSKYQFEKDFFSLPYDERSYAMMKFARFASASFPSKSMQLTIQFLMRMPFIQNYFVPSNWQAYYKILNAYMNNDYNLIDQVHKIDVKTTIFVGMLSEMYPVESSVFLSQQIKNSKLVSFKKSGHAVMMNEPIKFIIELNRFLSDHSDCKMDGKIT